MNTQTGTQADLWAVSAGRLGVGGELKPWSKTELHVNYEQAVGHGRKLLFPIVECLLCTSLVADRELKKMFR